MSTDKTQPSTMRNHWWWRPGWAVGRSFYTWHITFAEQAELRELAEAYTPVLAELPMLDHIPVQWLHLTMQGVGFTDEVAQADVDAIVEAARRRLAELEPFTVTVGPPHVDPETIQMSVQPVEPLRNVRASIRAAIGEVWVLTGYLSRKNGGRTSRWLTPTPTGRRSWLRPPSKRVPPARPPSRLLPPP